MTTLRAVADALDPPGTVIALLTPATGAVAVYRPRAVATLPRPMPGPPVIRRFFLTCCQPWDREA